MSKSITAVLLTLSLFGCSAKQNLDTPARGTITIAADESFKPLVDQLTSAYMGLYPDAHFNIVYKPEQEAIATMLRDSARLVFTARELTQQERAVLDQRKIEGKTERIATDGVALIVSKANGDSLISVSEVQGLFTGRITQWSQMAGSRQSGPVTLVFDNNNSSNLSYMLKRFNITDVSKLRIFTVKSNREVVEYVRTNPSAIGFIGVNWISDGDEPLSAELSKDLRVMGISEKLNPTSRQDYFQPFQKDLGLENYPFRRGVYIVSREAHPGLGGGLINYVSRDAGTLIIEKLGLWPAIPYNREVYLER
ncbi:PstS family phosphate ABC transporter substrate-binding protein [Nibrella saemangeumensis]|uniref:PstS family phosphate ABC transporter substrate-binding protein n=1 Tax=Nibrella saemangeumensis TaxID=1084526 RepID=UPI003CD08344